jgi:hypothetical protein
MRHFLKSLLVSASIVSIAYFVWWGCFPPNRPCFNTLDELPTLVVQLDDGGRGPTLFIRTLDCYEPEADLEVSVNGQQQEAPVDFFDFALDATDLLGAEAVDLEVTLRDSTATWNLVVPGYLQDRSWVAQEATTTPGAPVVFDWTSDVNADQVDASVSYADTSTQTVSDTNTTQLSITPPAGTGAGTANVTITSVINTFTPSTCDGPPECIVEPTFINETVSFTVE